MNISIFSSETGKQFPQLLGLILCSVLVFSGCDDDDDDNDSDSTNTDAVDPVSDSAEGLDPTLFVSGALVESATTESCVLSGGTEATCYRIEIAGVPAGQEVGPFCPLTIFTEAEEAGIWFDGGGDVYDLDGEFVTNLANLYGDDNWLLYDTASGDVNITDTQEACEAAARPNVDVQYQNHCVECALEYVDGGVTQTLLIPTSPVALPTPDDIRMGDLGVSLNGVILAPPAPVDAILSAYTIAAFDDCGGHVNPVAGYHYHGATGCTETVTQDDGHAALMGYVIDGYALHGMLNTDGTEPTDLDECRGHPDAARGYHYHAASAGENIFIGCFNGEQGTIE